MFIKIFHLRITGEKLNNTSLKVHNKTKKKNGKAIKLKKNRNVNGL